MKILPARRTEVWRRIRYLLRKVPILYFVVDPRWIDLGSVRIRAVQFANALNSAEIPMVAALKWSTTDMSRIKTNSYVVFGPTTISLLERSTTMVSLRRRNAVLMVDRVDRRLGNGIDFDFLLCSSATEYESELISNRRPALFLPHQLDEEIRGCQREPLENRVVYLGSPDNAINDLEGVDYVFLDGVTRRRSLLNAVLPHASAGFHLIARPSLDSGRFKPFTKGLIAAHFGAAVITSADDAEAIHWLGPDYPYIARSTKLSDLQEIVEYAKSSYQTDVYDRAVSLVSEVYRRIVEEGLWVSEFSRFISNHHRLANSSFFDQQTKRT